MNIKSKVPKAAVPGLSVVHALLTLPPVLLTGCIYRLAQRATVLIGRWPVPMINDPKWIGENDAIYQHLYGVVDRVDGVAFYTFFLWIVLALLLFRSYSWRARLVQIGLFVSAWGLLWFNPWSLLYWWED